MLIAYYFHSHTKTHGSNVNIEITKHNLKRDKTVLKSEAMLLHRCTYTSSPQQYFPFRFVFPHFQRSGSFFSRFRSSPWQFDFLILYHIYAKRNKMQKKFLWIMRAQTFNEFVILYIERNSPGKWTQSGQFNLFILFIVGQRNRTLFWNANRKENTMLNMVRNKRII